MGNLIIKKIIYSGDNYFFESPELTTGINIIVGDNGSGKSTFAYFIEYGLGGDIQYFKNNKDGRYDLIVHDTNNYVLLELEIDKIQYSLKRFIGNNDIFVKENDEVKKYPIIRNSEYAPYIFSDWILEKLDISVFSLTLGTIDWLINFRDLFRLLDYDQDTEARKIFKAPSSENFVVDSVIIRKAVFETLVGITSEEYNIKYNEFKKSQTLRNDSKALLDNFLNLHNWIDTENINLDDSTLDKLQNQLEKLNEEREYYQKTNTNSSDKTNQLTEIQTELIADEIAISENSLKINYLQIESKKAENLLQQLNDEIAQIEKIIFTHDKLNLFSLEICPFCMSDVHTSKGQCLCGSNINDEDYEKFVYKSSEYKGILDHKKKSVQAIQLAFNSYEDEIFQLDRDLTFTKVKSENLKDELRNIIDTIAFTGNSQMIDRLNDKILEVRQNIINEENTTKLFAEYSRLQTSYELKNKVFKQKKQAYEKIQAIFEKNNKETILEFNAIYNDLLKKSSYQSHTAEINEDYMPYIDGGTYREKSAIVPIRLMYYFTLLTLGLKRDNVKHPRFLLIDTPEEAGIDEGNLKLNLSLLNDAIKLGIESGEEDIKEFQVILTTGEDKFPEVFSDNIKLILNKAKGNFILKSKN